MVKPGYRTSEFWFTLVSFIFSGLYLSGIIHDPNQKDDLINETSRGLEALILIIGQLVVLFKYVKGRTELKKIWWSTNNESKELSTTIDTINNDVTKTKINKKSKTRKKKL